MYLRELGLSSMVVMENNVTVYYRKKVFLLCSTTIEELTDEFARV
jgi:hypothetical protein